MSDSQTAANPDRKLFNTGTKEAPVIFKVSVPSPDSDDGRKRCEVRYPTDEEWSKLTRDSVTVRRSLGRDASRQDPRKLDGDMELFEKIRVDKDGPSFDEAEAALVLLRLNRTDITEVRQLGNIYRMKMTVLGGVETLHVIKMPTQQQTRDFNNSAMHTTSRRNLSETRTALEPGAQMYDKLIQTVEGYAEGGSSKIPINHKDTIATELANQVVAFLDEPDPEV